MRPALKFALANVDLPYIKFEAARESNIMCFRHYSKAPRGEIESASVVQTTITDSFRLTSKTLTTRNAMWVWIETMKNLYEKVRQNSFPSQNFRHPFVTRAYLCRQTDVL